MGLFDTLDQAGRRTVNKGHIKLHCPKCKKATNHRYKSEHSSKKVCLECGHESG